MLTLFAQVVPPTPGLGDILAPLLQLADLAKLGPAAVVVAVLLVLARLGTFYGAKLPGKVGEAFASPVAAWVLPLVLAVLGALSTALASGAPVTLGLVLGAVLAGLAAAGTGNKQAVLAAAVKSGEVAAVKVDSTAAAVDALAKGGGA